MIERPNYLDRLLRLRGTGLAKVLTGMRRAGKSGILRLLEQKLHEDGVGTDALLFINLELVQNASLRNAKQLLDYVLAHANNEQTTYVLIDEAQEAHNIGEVVYTLLENGGFDVFLTGSHSKLVQNELADIMSGRFVEIPVFPLSFAEYYASCNSSDSGKSNQTVFNDYLTNGGLPYTLRLLDDEYALRDYLDGVYHTVVRRDVATGLGHEDPQILDAITTQLVSSLGSPTSANGVSKALLESGRACSDDTVSRYLTALTDAYAFYKLSRIDLKTQTVLKTQEKYYVGDVGLCSLLLGPNATDLQGLIENVVYLELRQRYSTVYAGKHYARSISFVAGEAHDRHYYMVAPSVLDPNTLQRTLGPLRAERDNYPKTILTLDEVGLPSHGGIRQRNLVDWLLEKRN